MGRTDDDRLPSTFTTRDTTKPFRDSTGRLIPPRSNAPLLRDIDGAPCMDERMLDYIATPRQRVERPGDPPAPLSFNDAWARLRTQEPPLAAAVTATVIHRFTVREAAPFLGCSSATAARRKGEALAALSIWTGLPVLNVARQVKALTA